MFAGPLPEGSRGLAGKPLDVVRGLEHRGGLDAFLVKAGEGDLSQTARLLKREIHKKLAETPAVAA